MRRGPSPHVRPTKLVGEAMGHRLYPKKEILLYAGSRVSVRAYHPGQARGCALGFSVSAYRDERRSNAYRESAGGFRTTERHPGYKAARSWATRN